MSSSLPARNDKPSPRSPGADTAPAPAVEDFIAVLDFGGQYAHLIARRIRHLGVLAKVFPPLAPTAELKRARGIVLSGGPRSVNGADAVPFNPDVLTLDIPLLGLCYGHQVLAHHLGGKVRHLDHGEFGKTRLSLRAGDAGALFEGVPRETEVWMSHGDTVVQAPDGFDVLAETALTPVAAMRHRTRPVYGMMFHPEVNDTPEGARMLANFVALTGARKTWTMDRFIAAALDACRRQVDGRNVLMFLSGGVDSTVAYALLSRALGAQRLRGLLVDNGFLRKDEARRILDLYRRIGFEGVDAIDASGEFLAAVAGLTDPQEKRKAVGETFLRVRDGYLAGLKLDPEQWLLGQGTLYPDIIESGGTRHAEVIKFHHNRVQRIEELIAAGRVIEPLKDLYKDEVRALGETLGLPAEAVWRHPFPGPGLSINVLCASGAETYAELPEARLRVGEVLRGSAYAGDVLPVRSVGVQGDSRTYALPAVLLGPQDWTQLDEQSTRITNSVRAVNRVVTLLAPSAPSGGRPALPTLRPHRAYCTRDRLDVLREADALLTDAVARAGLMREVFQILVILLPLGNDEQGECVVLRPVVSEDVMTARFARLPWELVNAVARDLLRVPRIHAVFYDVTHKPPATFGWE
ncbi:MAG: glutamine-hydrolyzing GMP synthase [SAR324 cluster bacterium]